VKKKSVRLVRIGFSLESGAVRKSIEQVLKTLGGELVQFVPLTEENDLVIFDEVRKIEDGFHKDKTYVYLSGINREEKNQSFPKNVKIIHVTRVVEALLSTVGELYKKLQSIVDSEISLDVAVEVRSDAKRILVIDDDPKNIANAKKTLAGHHLVTVSSYKDAMVVLNNAKFDVVLTDLHLPMSSKTLSSDAFKLGELVPYGMLLMVEAARQGAKYVAVVTDLSHHADPFSAAFDHFSGFSIKIEGAKVRMLHAVVTKDGKDWVNALGQVLA
jgi:CheY-like chemotaxis protein